jgi:hypothetical protein
VGILERGVSRVWTGPATRIYLAAGVTDMRKGFEGELSLLMGGIDLTKTKHKRWYRKASPEGHAAE